MGSSYCKNNYSKDKVSVARITQIRPEKMKKSVAMASFCCLVSKIWKKTVLYVAIKRRKNAWFVLFFMREKWYNIFMQVRN